MTISTDYYASHRFWVEISSITEGAFTECSGLEQEVDVFEWQEGGFNTGVHRFPGRVKAPPHLVLKRGLVSTDLWQWFAAVSQGTITRRSLSILLYGYGDQPSIRWDVTGALPVKWTGPSFTSTAQEVAVESLELVYQSFERK